MLGIAVIGSVVLTATQHGSAGLTPVALRQHAVNAIQLGFGVAAVGFVLALVAAALLLRRADSLSERV